MLFFQHHDNYEMPVVVGQAVWLAGDGGLGGPVGGVREWSADGAAGGFGVVGFFADAVERAGTG